MRSWGVILVLLPVILANPLRENNQSITCLCRASELQQGHHYLYIDLQLLEGITGGVAQYVGGGLAPKGSNILPGIRSKNSLMEHARYKGSEFVETLRTIKYPKNLHAEDFVSLYDDLDCKHFLNWFCRSLEKDDVLSTEQIEYYEFLQTTGKTILEGDKLEENLSICHSSEKSRKNLEETRVKALGEDECSLQVLETEAANLKCLKTLRAKALEQLKANMRMQQFQASDLQYSERDCAQKLKPICHSLDNENSQLNFKLLKTRESLEHLACSYSDEGTQTLPPMLLSKMALSQYVRLDERFEEALAQYTKVTMQHTENREASALKESTREVLECNLEKSKKDLQQELHQLQLGHFSRLREQCSTQAAVCSYTATLHWAEKTLGLYRHQLPDMEKQSFRNVIGLREQLLDLEEDVAQLKTDRLLPLLKASASTFSLPVLLGDLDTEDVRLQYVTSKQQDLQRHLLRQWARLDLLTLGLDAELRDHGHTANVLDEFQCGLHTMVSSLHKRLAWMGKSNVLSKRASSMRIDVRDQTFMRLWELLDDPSIPKPLLQKYEFLERQAMTMSLKLCTLNYRLQNYFLRLSSIQSICRELHRLMYNHSETPLVNSLELSEAMDKLGRVDTQLAQIVLEMKDRLEEKRRAPMYPFLREERDLYVHFFQDPEHLVQVVEELEVAALALSNMLQ